MSQPHAPGGGKAAPAPEEPDERALAILDAVLGVAAEVILDLDVTWNTARDRFAAVLFGRAEERYGTAPKVAAALHTSLRTVKQYRHRRRERGEEVTGPTFNVRRRILHLLDEGPAALSDMERRLPSSSDVNLVRSAVLSLEQDGLVTFDRNTGIVRRTDPSFVPWYRRPDLHPGARLDLFFRGFARLLGTRLTPQGERAAEPALLAAVMHHLPPEQVRAYQEDFLDTMDAFDRRWTKRAEAAAASSARGEPAPRVRAGAAVAVGDMGPPLAAEQVARLAGTHALDDGERGGAGSRGTTTAPVPVPGGRKHPVPPPESPPCSA